MIAVKGFNVVVRSVMIVMATLVSGCAGGYGANSQPREEFEHHIEEVFRLQNQMTSEVMMLLENDGVKNQDGLIRAEQHMQQVCADLIEYVSRNNDGLNGGFLLGRRVEKSAIDCERAALAVKPLLKP
jgi:hypothetical protein